MSKKPKDPQPSRTALFTTLARAVANRESNNGVFGRDCLAEAFLPFHTRVSLKVKTIRTRIKHKIPPGMYEYLLARTAYFDTVFEDALDRNVPQIVLLGAGYDTRAYRFAKLIKDTKIIELDAPLIQNRKRMRLLQSHITIPNNIVFAPINFDAEPLPDVLEKAGYNKHKNTLFLMEGLTYYLEPESVDATLKFATNNFNGASTIVFDYILSTPTEKLNDYYGARELYENHIKKFPDEKGKFFIEEGTIASYLEQRGLKIIEHLDNREMEKRFLVNNNGVPTGKVTGWFRIVSASPNV